MQGESEEDSDDSFSDRGLIYTKIEDLPPILGETPLPPSLYNALHEMESVCWMSIHFLLNRERSLPAPTTAASLTQYATLAVLAPLKSVALMADDRQYARSLFHGQSVRRDVMLSKDIKGTTLKNTIDRLPGHALLLMR